MNGSGWGGARTIVESPQASKSIDFLTITYERFADQWVGFSWLLARKPENSLRQHHRGTSYHLLHRKGDNEKSLLDIAVVYQYDDDEVNIIDIHAWEAPNPAGSEDES